MTGAGGRISRHRTEQAAPALSPELTFPIFWAMTDGANGPDAGLIVPALVERLDAVVAEVAAIRAALAAIVPAAEVDGNNPTCGIEDTEAADFAPENLIDTTTAAARWNRPRDTLALWCRQGDGVKRGGRWLASVPRIQRARQLPVRPLRRELSKRGVGPHRLRPSRSVPRLAHAENFCVCLIVLTPP